MGTSVGLTLNGDKALAVKLRASGSKARIKKILAIERNENNFPGLNLLAKEGISTKRLSLAIPTELVNLRKVRLPLRSPPQIRRALFFYVEKIFPDVSADEILLDHLITERAEDSTELLLVVIKKRDLDQYLSKIGFPQKFAGSVTLDFVALYNLIDHLGLNRKSEVTVSVFFFDSRIIATLSNRGHFVGVRAFPALGSSPPAERLNRELRLFLASEGFELRPDRVILCGKVPEGLKPEDINSEQTVFLDAQKVLRAPSNFSPEALIAAGSALIPLKKASLTVNLKKHALQPSKTPYEVVRTPIFISSLAALFFLGAQLLETMQLRGQAEGYLRRLSSEARTLFYKVAGDKKLKFSSSFHKTIESLAKRQASQGDMRAGWESFLDFLAVLCENLPADYNIVIQSVNFRSGKAIIRGEASNVERFDALARSLEKSGKFKVRTPFRMKSGRKSFPERLSFSIELSPGS